MNLLPPVASLCLGLIVGYLGQRARLCFIGGMRDYHLVRDTFLIKGLLAFLVAALVGFGIFYLISPALKTFPWFLHGGAVFTKKMGYFSYCCDSKSNPPRTRRSHIVVSKGLGSSYSCHHRWHRPGLLLHDGWGMPLQAAYYGLRRVEKRDSLPHRLCPGGHSIP